MELDALNYFLIFMGGFGAVWGFRHFSKSNKKITEFEYAGFSALYGIPIFVILMLITKNSEGFLEKIFIAPMFASPFLFAIGLFCSYVAWHILCGVRRLYTSEK